jgi:hypothetical protein
MVFESAKTLSAHQHASLHCAKTILHDSKSFRKACSEFCRRYSKEHRFTRRPDSAFRCGTCLTKYSYEEGLKVHLAFWKYSDYDPVKAYEDIGRLFDLFTNHTQNVLNVGRAGHFTSARISSSSMCLVRNTSILPPQLIRTTKKKGK